jgi:hypothetical protein
MSTIKNFTSLSTSQKLAHRAEVFFPEGHFEKELPDSPSDFCDARWSSDLINLINYLNQAYEQSQSRNQFALEDNIPDQPKSKQDGR